MIIDEERLKQDLIRDEGLRFFPYQDTKGNLTIGIGRNLNRGLTKLEVDFFYHYDAGAAIRNVGSLGLTLNEVRTRALVNMCFNLGLGGLEGFTEMLKALRSGDWKRAAKESLDSLWADESDGLRDAKPGVRARRIAYMLEHGEDAPF